MNKFLKYKNILIYIFSVLVSVYFFHLFFNMWTMGKKGFIIMLLTFIIIALLLTRFYIKKSKEFSFTKRQQKIVIIVSVLISVVFLIIGPTKKFLINKYTDSSIIIKPLKENSKIDISIIDSITHNNINYLRYGDVFNNEYDNLHNVNKNNVKVLNENNEIKIYISKSYAPPQIIFSNPIKGIVILDNNKKAIIGEDNTEQIIYRVRSYTSKGQNIFIKYILSFIALVYIIYILIKLLMSLKDKNERFLIILGLLTMIVMIIYNLNSSIAIFPDSYTYIDFPFADLLHFIPNGRTPIYPMIINLIRFIFPNQFLEFVVLFQNIVWFISIIYLYKIIYLLTKKVNLSFIFSLLYAIAPFAVAWNGCILTESLALSGTIVFIYYILKYIKTEKAIYGTVAIILTLVLTFLRPTSIIYLLGTLVFIILRIIFEHHKKCDLKCLLTELICIVVVVIYAILFHRQYGVYTISDAVIRQDLMVTMREGFYKNSDDKDFVKNIEIAYEKNPDNEWAAMLEVLGKYSPAKMKELTNKCRKKNWKVYKLYIKRLAKEYASGNFLSYGYIGVNGETLWLHKAMSSSFSIFTFLHVYILIFIETILTIIKWIKSRKVPWIYCGLFSFPLVIIVSSFVGTCGEFMRTAVCCVPFAYLILIMLIYDFLIKEESKHDRITKEK